MSVNPAKKSIQFGSYREQPSEPVEHRAYRSILVIIITFESSQGSSFLSLCVHSCKKSHSLAPAKGSPSSFIFVQPRPTSLCTPLLAHQKEAIQNAKNTFERSGIRTLWKGGSVNSRCELSRKKTHSYHEVSHCGIQVNET